jgi:hypothetical protein
MKRSALAAWRLRMRGLVDFRDDVRHAQQVLPRELHLAFGELSPLLVLGDACRFVDEGLRSSGR